MIFYVCGKKGFGKTSFVKKELIPKWKRVVVLDSLGFEYPYKAADSIGEFADNLKANVEQESFYLTYNPLDNREEEFFKFCLVLTSCLIVVEETDLFCTTSQIDPSLDRLIRYGRHRKLDLVFLSRRPAEVHRNVTAQADVIVSFKQTEPRDLEYFRKITDDFESLRHLKKWKYGQKMVQNVHYKYVLENSENVDSANS
jgi:hypothetical protein